MTSTSTSISTNVYGNDFLTFGPKLNITENQNTINFFGGYEQSLKRGNNGFISDLTYNYNLSNKNKTLMVSPGARARVRSSNGTIEFRPQITFSGPTHIDKNTSWYATVYDREIIDFDGKTKNTHGAFAGFGYKASNKMKMYAEIQCDSKSGWSYNCGLNINL